MKDPSLINFFTPANPQAIRMNDDPVQEVYRIICEQINYNTKLIELIKETIGVNYVEVLVLFVLPNFNLDLLKEEYKNRADLNGIVNHEKLIATIQYDLNDYIKIKKLLEQCEDENADKDIDIECIYMHLFCMKSRLVSHLGDRSSEMAVERLLKQITDLSPKEIKEYVRSIDTENSAATSDIKPLTECLSLLHQLLNANYKQFMNHCEKLEDIGAHANYSIKRLDAFTLKLKDQSAQAFSINRDLDAANERMQLLQEAQGLLDFGPIAKIVHQSARNPQQEICDGFEGKSSSIISIGNYQINMDNYMQIHQIVQNFILPLEFMSAEVKTINDNLSSIVHGHNAASFAPQNAPKKSQGKNKHDAARSKKKGNGAVKAKSGKQQERKKPISDADLKNERDNVTGENTSSQSSEMSGTMNRDRDLKAQAVVNDIIQTVEPQNSKLTVTENTQKSTTPAAVPRTTQQATEKPSTDKLHDDNLKQSNKRRSIFEKVGKKQFFKRIAQDKPQPKIPDNIVTALTKHRENFEKMFAKPTPNLIMTFDELKQLVISAGGEVKPNGGSYFRIVLFGTYTQVLARNPLIAMQQKLKTRSSKNSEEKSKESFGKTSLVAHAPHGKSHNNGMVKSYVVIQFMEAFVRVGLTPEKLWSDNADLTEKNPLSTSRKMQ